MDLFYLIIDKFNFSAKNKYSLEHEAGRYIVKYAAENFYNIENSELEVINKKPKFKYSDIHFSISHSYNIAAVCFYKNPVGFDIEYIKPRDYLNIAKRMHLKMIKNSPEEFYKCWTLFEAEIKLQAPLKSAFTTKFNDEYIISAVSSDSADIKLNFHELN